jgi:hypothetical protein
LETLTTGYGRSPWSIRKGDLLRSAIPGKFHKVKVEQVDPPNSNGYITITTTEGPHIFRPDQPVVFPRRGDGLVKVHWDDFPSLEEVVIGDVIAPLGGWPGHGPDLSSGRVVTDILRSPKLGGYILSYRPVDGSPGGKMLVPAVFPVLANTPDCKLLKGGEARSKARLTREPKNASGFYINLETGQKVRFRIKGVQGRPPHCDLLQSPGPIRSEWEAWKLDSGRRHPEDPRG